MIIPISDGRLIVSVEISEGATKFLYVVKLVPPKALGSMVHPILFTESIIRTSTIHWKYWHLALFTESTDTIQWKYQRLALFNHKYVACTNFLEIYG